MNFPAKPEFLDSSKVCCFMECPRKYFYSYVLNWHPETESHHLGFGTAWHAAMECLYKGAFSDESRKEAHKAFMKAYIEKVNPNPKDPQMEAALAPKNLMNGLAGISGYFDQYSGQDYVLALGPEIGGRVQIGDSLLTFKMDSVLKGNGGYYLQDHKTGSTYSQAWANKWETSFQMDTYLYACSVIVGFENVRGAIIDGAFFYKSKAPEFHRIMIPCNATKIELFMATANSWLTDIDIEHEMLIEEAAYDNETMQCFPRNTTSCSDYFGCPYKDFCLTWLNPISRCEKPPIGYVQRIWNPLEETPHYILHDDGTFEDTATKKEMPKL